MRLICTLWAAGGASLRVELRPVKAQPLPGKTTVATGNVIASPPARFAHSAVAFQRAEEVDIVVFGGVRTAYLTASKF